MFQMMLSFSSLLVLFCIILQTRGTLSDTNVVLCSGINQQEDIQCPQDYIIDVNSVTVATLSVENQTCSTNVTQAIVHQEEQCKSSTGDKGRYQIFRRCHGNQSCSVDGSVVDNLSFGSSCKTKIRLVWFNYSCYYVNSSSPSVAVLPVSEDRPVQGFEVEIFSPYYPCYTTRPKKISWWECKLAPKRNNMSSLTSYVVKVKNVEFHRNLEGCGDYLSFRFGDKIDKHYCGDVNRGDESWNKEIKFDNFTEHLTVRFQTNTFAGGARFWLVVKAFKDEEPIELNLTCNGQDNIPPLLSDCSLLPVTPAPNSTDEITNADKVTSKGFLFGILGGLFVLLLLVGVAVFLLVSVFRKRQQEKNTPPAAPPKRLRPRSMQQLATLLKPRRKTPFYPETEPPADGGATATGGDNSGSGHHPTTPVQAVENCYVDNQRSVPGSGNNLNSSHSPALNNNDGYDAVMCENGGLNIPTAVPTVSEEVCENETVEAGNEQLYALPKKVNGPGTQNDETVMCENADLYSPVSDETASPEIPPEFYEAVFGKDLKA